MIEKMMLNKINELRELNDTLVNSKDEIQNTFNFEEITVDVISEGNDNSDINEITRDTIEKNLDNEFDKEIQDFDNGIEEINSDIEKLERNIINSSPNNLTIEKLKAVYEEKLNNTEDEKLINKYKSVLNTLDDTRELNLLKSYKIFRKKNELPKYNKLKNEARLKLIKNKYILFSDINDIKKVLNEKLDDEYKSKVKLFITFLSHFILNKDFNMFGIYLSYVLNNIEYHMDEELKNNIQSLIDTIR